MGGKRALLLGLLLGAPGCFGPSSEAQESLARVQQEARELERALDDVEGRLIGGQALLQHWQELSRRHRVVSAVACGNAVAHTTQMVAIQERQLQWHRRRLYVAGEGGVGGPAP